MKENVVTSMNAQKGMFVPETQSVRTLKAASVVSAMRDIVVICAQISMSVLTEQLVAAENLNA